MKKWIRRIIPSVVCKALQGVTGEFRHIRAIPHGTDSYMNVFPYRPDDVVIVSYPRSGSTWLRFIMAHLIKDMIPNGPPEVDFSTLSLTVPAISELSGSAGIDFEALPSPRIMRSHSRYSHKFPRVIYLMRDGRDVLVSFYYYFKKMDGFNDTLYEFLCGAARKVKFGEWDEHVNSWIYQNHSLSNLCLVRYEDILCDPFREVGKLVHFIGLHPTAEQIRKAIEKSSFDKMKQIEEKKGLGPILDKGDPQIRFIRKGGSSNWREYLGEKEKALIKERYGNALIRAGYESSFQW